MRWVIIIQGLGSIKKASLEGIDDNYICRILGHTRNHVRENIADCLVLQPTTAYNTRSSRSEGGGIHCNNDYRWQVLLAIPQDSESSGYSTISNESSNI